MKRWRTVVVWLVAILLLIIVGAWVMAPAILVQQAKVHLPYTNTFSAGSFTVAANVGTQLLPPNTRPDLQVIIPAPRATNLAREIINTWIPPGIIRTGLNAQGTLALPILRPAPFTWQAAIGGISERPICSAIIQAHELSAFLREHGQTIFYLNKQPIMRVNYVVRGGKITDVTTPNLLPFNKRLAVEAHGSIILQAGQTTREVQVRRLAGYAAVSFTPDATLAAQYRMKITIAIEESDTDPITVPILGDIRPMLLEQLATAANDGLRDGLEKVLLPAWVPFDTQVNVVVE
jgi:hypothetical protein